MTGGIPMAWGWAFVVLTQQSLATNLKSRHVNTLLHTDKKLYKLEEKTATHTSEHGGQSPLQQRRLQACRPQSLIL